MKGRVWFVQVTKRVDTAEDDWRGWNWRSEGDILVNGAFFVASGAELEVKYEKAYSVEPKSAVLIDLLTMHSGVLGVGGRYTVTFLFFPFFSLPLTFFFSFTFNSIPFSLTKFLGTPSTLLFISDANQILGFISIDILGLIFCHIPGS